MNYILFLIILVLFILIFCNWSDYLLKQESMYPLYRNVLEVRADKLYNQYKIICNKYNINGKKILDFGCGFGGLGYKLRNNGYQVLSVDIKNHYIYNDKHNDNLSNFIKINPLEKYSDKLPFNKKSFDVSVSSYCFHHIPIENHEIILNELKRVSNTIILLEEDPSMNLICRFLNSEIFTHANSHMTIENWKKHLETLGYFVNIYEFNSKEFGIVINY